MRHAPTPGAGSLCTGHSRKRTDVHRAILANMKRSTVRKAKPSSFRTFAAANAPPRELHRAKSFHATSRADEGGLQCLIFRVPFRCTLMLSRDLRSENILSPALRCTIILTLERPLRRQQNREGMFKHFRSHQLGVGEASQAKTPRQALSRGQE